MKNKVKKKKALLAATVAGLLTVAGTVISSTVAYAGGVMCAGINGCAGKADCGGKNNSCAGKNACKGQGWTSVPSAEACTTAGGRVVSEMEAQEAEEHSAEDKAVMAAEAKK